MKRHQMLTYSVVPGHLVNTGFEQRLKFRIDALADEPGKHELVDKHHSGVCHIEHKQQAQAVRARVERALVCASDNTGQQSGS